MSKEFRGGKGSRKPHCCHEQYYNIFIFYESLNKSDMKNVQFPHESMHTSCTLTKKGTITYDYCNSVYVYTTCTSIEAYRCMGRPDIIVFRMKPHK